MIEIRPVRPDEVYVRIKTCYENKAQFLLYIDSRACRNILDETFGVLGWKNEFKEVKGNLYCSISIYDSTNNIWITKEDCGTQTAVEKEKGEASDAFKRAAYSVGVARELYTRIPLWIDIPTVKIDGSNKYKPKNTQYTKFKVARIEVNKNTRKINYLSIVDGNEKEVFSWGYSYNDTPYTDAENEASFNVLRLYCEEYSVLKNCNIDVAIKAAMKGLNANKDGYAKATVKIKQEIAKLKGE